MKRKSTSNWSNDGRLFFTLFMCISLNLVYSHFKNDLPYKYSQPTFQEKKVESSNSSASSFYEKDFHLINN